jgi:hypothetical protein
MQSNDKYNRGLLEQFVAEQEMPFTFRDIEKELGFTPNYWRPMVNDLIARKRLYHVGRVQRGGSKSSLPYQNLYYPTPVLDLKGEFGPQLAHRCKSSLTLLPAGQIDPRPGKERAIFRQEVLADPLPLLESRPPLTQVASPAITADPKEEILSMSSEMAREEENKVVLYSVECGNESRLYASLDGGLSQWLAKEIVKSVKESGGKLELQVKVNSLQVYG